MSVGTTISAIASLRAASKVTVFVGERTGSYGDSILISEVKMNMIARAYENIYAFTHKAWRNIPDAPGCEPPYVIMWMLACEDYEVNHNTIAWQGAGPNTFVHIWSMIERLRNTLVEAGAEWVMGSRDSVGYCEATNTIGSTDAHIYMSEQLVLPQVASMARTMKGSVRTTANREFVSFFDMETSMMMPGSRWPTRP